MISIVQKKEENTYVGVYAHKGTVDDRPRFIPVVITAENLVSAQAKLYEFCKEQNSQGDGFKDPMEVFGTIYNIT